MPETEAGVHREIFARDLNFDPLGSLMSPTSIPTLDFTLTSVRRAGSDFPISYQSNLCYPTAFHDDLFLPLSSPKISAFPQRKTFPPTRPSPLSYPEATAYPYRCRATSQRVGLGVRGAGSEGVAMDAIGGGLAGRRDFGPDRWAADLRPDSERTHRRESRSPPHRSTHDERHHR